MHEATLRGLRAGCRRRGSVGHPDPRRLGRDGSRTDARRSLHTLLESTAPAPWPWSHADLPELRGAARGRICTVYPSRLSRLLRPLRPSVSASPRCSLWLRSGRALRGVSQRQADTKRSFACFARHVDRTAVVRHDAVRDGETQARSALFGRKEGIENRCVETRQTWPVVLDLDGHAARTTATAKYYAATTTRAGRLDRILQQVEQHLRQLGLVGLELEIHAGKVTGQRHARRFSLGLNQGTSMLTQPEQADGFELHRIRPREVQKFTDQVCEAGDLVAHHPRRLEHVLLARLLLDRTLQERDVQLSTVERVADFMRQTRCQRADCRKLFCLAGAFLHRP